MGGVGGGAGLSRSLSLSCSDTRHCVMLPCNKPRRSLSLLVAAAASACQRPRAMPRTDRSHFWQRWWPV